MTSTPVSNTVRFILNGSLVTLENPDPSATLLNWLRYDRGLTGTKEGCAEGDCGACTVVIGTLDGEGGLQQRAVNACILFLPTLDGKEVITVEGLAHPDSGALHPAQAAMVNCHGSQCGFCTPGFVMSLYALGETVDAPSRGQINDALAGNLCRCTGYGPIIEAARQMRSTDGCHHLRENRANRITALSALRRPDMVDLSYTDPVTGYSRRYFAPKTMADLVAVYTDHPDATILAGGTDVGLWVTKQQRQLDHVIYAAGVPELTEIQETDDGLTIGAYVTYTDAHTKIGQLYGDMGELIRRIGSDQVRNAGTIGGNIANGSPIGDSMPALIAAGASLTLAGPGGSRTMALEEYFIDYGKQDRKPGEFVAHLSLPKPAAGQKYRAYKLSKRFDQDISAVCGAISLTLDGGIARGVRIAFGGMAATPKRARAAEAALEGQAFTEQAVKASMAAMRTDFSPITDMRSSETYRQRAAANLLFKAWLEITGQSGDSRLVGDKELAHA